MCYFQRRTTFSSMLLSNAFFYFPNPVETMLHATVTTWFLNLCLDNIHFCAPEMSSMFLSESKLRLKVLYIHYIYIDFRCVCAMAVYCGQYVFTVTEGISNVNFSCMIFSLIYLIRLPNLEHHNNIRFKIQEV